MRNVATAQAESQQASTSGPGPSSNTLQGDPGLARAGGKRENDDELESPRGSKIAKQGEDPAAAARLFDNQRNLFAMEYMKHGDVCDCWLDGLCSKEGERK